jgi:hypothetical protein
VCAAQMVLYLMSGTGGFSLVGQVLSERNWNVSDLIDRLAARGYNFDRKTIYRLTNPFPMQRIDARLLRALSEALELRLDQLISLQIPKLRKLDSKADKRLSLLMGKNSRGELTPDEKAEFQTLGAIAEKLSLENARILAAYRKLNLNPNLDELPRERVAVRFRSHLADEHHASDGRKRAVAPKKSSRGLILRGPQS